MGETVLTETVSRLGKGKKGKGKRPKKPEAPKPPKGGDNCKPCPKGTHRELSLLQVEGSACRPCQKDKPEKKPEDAPQDAPKISCVHMSCVCAGPVITPGVTDKNGCTTKCPVCKKAQK